MMLVEPVFEKRDGHLDRYGKRYVDVLEERGFIDNKTHEQELRDCIDAGPVTCYIGFDPTASSLHIGQPGAYHEPGPHAAQGHRPIALVGGGTGLVGDPSGKTEMRKMLTIDDVKMPMPRPSKHQLEHFIDFLMIRRFWPTMPSG
jgi:tyrosyl-tRNA synthetase